MGIDEPRRRRLLPFALLGTAALVVLLAFVMTIGGQPTYVGVEECNKCHDDIVDEWHGTLHGTDFANDWSYHDEPTNKYTYNSEDPANGTFGPCGICHVVGLGETDKGGFDASLPWNDSHNMPLLGIQCEACHGAGSEHADSKDAEDIDTTIYAWSLSCGGNEAQDCHSGYRQFGGEYEGTDIRGFGESAHFSGVPASVVNAGIDCAHCMESKTFATEVGEWSLTEVPDDPIYNITCAACHDPHEQTNEYQLRAPVEEICEKCHWNTHTFPDTHVRHPTTEFRNGMNGQGVPVTTFMEDVSCPECHMYTSPRGTPWEDYHQSHSWDPAPEACVECHSMYTAETAMAWIEETQEHIEGLLTPVEALHANAMAVKDWAEGNGTWTEALNMTYLKAEWNIEMVVQEGSGGVHNPPYAEALLRAAEKGFGEVLDSLNIGGVSGKLEWKDGKAIADAAIKDSAGATVATTADDGTYSFFGSAKAMVYTIWEEGKLIGSVTIDATSHQSKDIGTTTLEKATAEGGEEEEGDDFAFNTLATILVVIIIILIVLMVFMMMRKK